MAEQANEKSPLRWRRVAAAAVAGMLVVGVLAWFLTGDTYQLWSLERQPTARLERTVREQPEVPLPAWVLGTRYAEQDRLEEAMDLFEKARNLDPNNYRPHFSLGLGFLRLGAAAAAVPELERAAALAPRESRVHAFLGHAYRLSNRYMDAVRAGEQAVKLAPRSAEAWYQLGATYYRPTGQQGKGRDCFRRAVELDPDNALYRRDTAQSFSDVGEYKTAEEHARAAVRLAPTDPVAKYLLGKILHRSHAAPEEAESLLREAVRLSPNTFQPHYELGLMLEERGEHAGALAEFEASSRINDRHEQSWFHQANNAARIGRKAQAEAARKRFLALTRYRDERQYLERRVFDHPDDAALRLRFAAVLEKNNELEYAALQCQRVLARDPNHGPARALLKRLAARAEKQAAPEPSVP